MKTIETVSPAEFMAHYFGDQWSSEIAADFAAKMRGEQAIFKHCERYTGQERLDAWADTEAQSRWPSQISPVTCDLEQLLAHLAEVDAEGWVVHIIENPEDDFLSPVDLRTLDSERLAALRDEAGAAGDSIMVDTIDAVLDAR